MINELDDNGQKQPHYLVMILEACVTVGCFEGLGVLVPKTNTLYNLNAQLLSDLLRSLATLHEKHQSPAIDKEEQESIFEEGVLALIKMLKSDVAAAAAAAATGGKPPRVSVKPLNISNIVGACATMGYHKSPGVAKLLQLVTDHTGRMEEATSLAWFQLLWGSAKLGLYHTSLFSTGMEAVLQQLKGQTASDVSLHHLTMILWACAECCHTEQDVMKLMQAVMAHDSWKRGASSKELANAAFSASVLGVVVKDTAPLHQACCELLQAVFDVACNQHSVDSFEQEQLRQLHQAHVAATQQLDMSAGLPPGPLLKAVTKVIWHKESNISQSQKDVAEVLEKMGLKVVLEAPSSDGLMRVDILITHIGGQELAEPVAMDYDGPRHYLQHSARQLTGRSRLRHAHLKHLYPGRYIVIPHFKWDDDLQGTDTSQGTVNSEARKDNKLAAQVKYLSQLLASCGLHVPPVLHQHPQQPASSVSEGSSDQLQGTQEHRQQDGEQQSQPQASKQHSQQPQDHQPQCQQLSPQGQSEQELESHQQPQIKGQGQKQLE